MALRLHPTEGDTQDDFRSHAVAREVSWLLPDCDGATPGATECRACRGGTMQFDGPRLIDILGDQSEDVGVKSGSYGIVAVVSPSEALQLAETGLYFGVGNKRRIRFLRRVGASAVLNAGSRTTQRIRNEAGAVCAAPFHIEHRHAGDRGHTETLKRNQRVRTPQ